MWTFSSKFPQFSGADFPAPSAMIPYPEATNIVVGDAFFSAAQYLPSSKYSVDLHHHHGAHLLRHTSRMGFESRKKGIALEAVEIGNEADLYVNDGIRTQGYDEVAYVKECVTVTLVYRKDIANVPFRWVDFAGNISATLNLTAKSSPHIWSASFAGSSGSTTGFSPQAIIDQGILNTFPGPFITTYV